MIIHLEIFFFSIICFEIIKFFKLRFYFQQLLNLYKKLFKLFISKRISDHWKERVILKYSQLLFFNSFRFILSIVIITTIYLLIEFFDNHFGIYLISIMGIIETTLILILYNSIRKFFNAKL